jgi:hypothetical protein
LEEVRKHFPDSIYNTVIHLNIRLKEAASFGAPISTFDRQCVGFKDFDSLAREVVQTFRPEVISQTEVSVGLGPLPVKNGILFSYKAPDVGSVKLVGDFNNWTPDKDSELQKYPDGVWKKLLPLPPGKYHYGASHICVGGHNMWYIGCVLVIGPDCLSV